MSEQLILHSLDDTVMLAARLAHAAQPGQVFALRGTLGAGKTAFARAFVQALAGAGVTVNSPTFTLLQTYITPRGEIWHYDLYRIEDESALVELGLEEAAAHITLIEWPERLGHYPMPITHVLEFTLGEDGMRRVTVHLVGEA